LYIFICWLLAGTAFAQPAKQYSFTHYGASAGLSSNFAQQSVQDEQGYIWIATNNGLQRFDGVRFLTFQKQDGNPSAIPGNFIGQLVFDKKNRLWLVTSGGYVGIFDTKRFVYREVKVKLKDSTIQRHIPHGIATDEEGNIFLNFQNHEFLTWSEKNQEFAAAYNFFPELSSWKIIDFKHQSGTSKYWISRNEGMAVFDKARGQLSYAGHNAANEPIINQLGYVQAPAGMYVDKKKRMWFYTWWSKSSPAIYVYDLEERKEVMHDYNLFGIYKFYQEIFGFLEQTDGAIWIYGLGIFAQYDEKENKFIPVLNGYRDERSIDFANVRNLY
jgi:ligand-binding sensor domain-containing protein